jgi:hypothetical protein
MALGMVGHLLMQTRIQEQGFELAGLRSEAVQLAAEQSILQAYLDRQSTPQMLAYAASELGMVANPYTTFLILPTGEVQGTNLPAWGYELPVISAPPDLPTQRTPVTSGDTADPPAPTDPVVVAQ